MSDKPITIILSDLHIGGGPADKGDDHVYNNNQLRNFIEGLSGSPEGREGNVELFFNGDFLEFAQVKPEVYTINSSSFWCTEDESLQKLNAILEGHQDIFQALKEFQSLNNRVTLAAGNHDVDLYWSAVQNRIKNVAGDVEFELKKEICTRHDGKLAIGHGHQIDPANKFKDWEDPFGVDNEDKLRLEMCPGTLFMVKFVNKMEARYEFADNVIPFTSLARLLMREDKFGLGAIALAFTSFAVSNPLTFLGVDKNNPSIDAWAVRFQDNLNFDNVFLKEITELYRKAVDENATSAEVVEKLDGEKNIRAFLKALLVNVPFEEWINKFDSLEPLTLSIHGSGTSPAGSGTTLSVMKSNFSYDKESLRREAERLWMETTADVVVFGHTHQPDEYRSGDKVYFNPGSWTRYVDIVDMPKLKLVDLRNETDFPYELNYVRVERGPDGSLSAALNCFERQDGTRFANH
jgi:UDP-2,3-diacylglucosamine pyrophosphatase LpxH